MWWTKWKYKSNLNIMSGSPRPLGSFDEEMLFPDDMSPIPPRPQQLVRPVAKRFLPVPGKRIRPEHVSIPVAPPPIPTFYDPTGRIERRKSAFSLNVDSVVKSPLRRTKKAGSRRRKARGFRSRKASRATPRR